MATQASGVVAEPLPRVGQRVEVLHVERVAPGRTVDGDRDHVVVEVVVDRHGLDGTGLRWRHDRATSTSSPRSQALAGLEQLDVPALELCTSSSAAGRTSTTCSPTRIGNDEAAELLRRNGREELGHARRVGRAIAIKQGHDFEPIGRAAGAVRDGAARHHRPRHAARSSSQGEQAGDAGYQKWADNEPDPEVARLLRLNGREETLHGERVTQAIAILGGRPPDPPVARRAEVAGAPGSRSRLGGLAPIVVAALLVPFRDEIDNANLALILVLVVVVAAILGGRGARRAGRGHGDAVVRLLPHRARTSRCASRAPTTSRPR